MLISYYCVHLDLFLCTVYQMGPRSLWRYNTVTQHCTACCRVFSSHPQRILNVKQQITMCLSKKSLPHAICINTTRPATNDFFDYRLIFIIFPNNSHQKIAKLKKNLKVSEAKVPNSAKPLNTLTLHRYKKEKDRTV